MPLFTLISVLDLIKQIRIEHKLFHRFVKITSLEERHMHNLHVIQERENTALEDDKYNIGQYEV